MSDSAQGASRDPATGRFLNGNAGGPGNPRVARLAEAQEAVRAAATPADVTAVLAKLHTLALAGDVAAARAWLERVLGKPAEVPLHASVTLPALRTAEDVAAALRAVAADAADGSIDLATALSLTTIIEKFATATTWAEIARQAAALVGVPAGRLGVA